MATITYGAKSVGVKGLAPHSLGMVYGRLNADRAAARATGGMDPALLRRRLSFPLNLSAATKRVELSSPSDPPKRKNTDDRNHDGGPREWSNRDRHLKAAEAHCLEG